MLLLIFSLHSPFGHFSSAQHLRLRTASCASLVQFINHSSHTKLTLRLSTEDHSQQGPSTDLFIFSQQSLNYLLGLIVGAFTNVHPANAAGFVQDKDRWPGVAVISAPQFEPVVRDDGILNSQRGDF